MWMKLNVRGNLSAMSIWAKRACHLAGRRRKGRDWMRQHFTGVVIVLMLGGCTVAVLICAGWQLAPIAMIKLDSKATERRLARSTCETNDHTNGGAATLILLIVGIIFTFNGLAIVCDEFFQASLEKIAEVLELTPDVAGATFLAAGSSAPELFTSLNDAFGPANSIGIGTIVGSAMFNILVIVALSAAVATQQGTKLPIDWRIVARDVSFYTASILLLGAMFIDGEIAWWEGLILMMTYMVYVIFMKYNERILGQCAPPKVSAKFASSNTSPGDGRVLSRRGEGEIGSMSDASALGDDGGQGPPRRLSKRDNRKASRTLRKSISQKPDSLDSATLLGSDSAKMFQESSVAFNKDSTGIASTKFPDWRDTDIEDDRLEFPNGGWSWFKFMFSFPFLVGLGLTVPDCSRPEYEKYYIVTFITSIAWIGLITHYMVEFATGAACILGVSAVVIGVLVLAVGTSVPDAIGSMIAAKNGEAAMAIANAVGSNVFDILLGLGFPWFLYGLVYGESTKVDAGGMTGALIILVCTVFVFVGVMMASGWTMNRVVGYGLMSGYAVYVFYTIFMETRG